MKRFVFIIMTLIFFSNSIGFALSPSMSKVLSSPDLSMILNGKPVKLDYARPFIDKSNRIQVPARFIAEAFGAKVAWDEATREIKITKDNTVLIFTIGSKEIKQGGTIFYDDGTVLENADDLFSYVQMDTVAMIKDQRTYVPIRYITEPFGVKIEWNSKTRTVNLMTNDTKDMQKPYFNSKYQIYSMFPIGYFPVKNAVNDKDPYIFDDKGAVTGFKSSFSSEIREDAGISYSENKSGLGKSYNIDILSNVNRTREQLIGQYIFTSGLKTEEFIVNNFQNITIISPKKINFHEVEFGIFKAKTLAFMVFNGKNVYTFSFTNTDVSSPDFTNTEIKTILNSIEIEGTKLSFEIKDMDILSVKFEAGTNTKKLDPQ